MTEIPQNIEALLSERRVFEPSAAFAERAVVSDADCVWVTRFANAEIVEHIREQAAAGEE
jgi:hypothetical protein